MIQLSEILIILYCVQWQPIDTDAGEVGSELSKLSQNNGKN